MKAREIIRILEKDGWIRIKSGYNILFYDFPGCVSAGKTLEETIKNGKIAL